VKIITNQEIASAINMQDAIEVMREAFLHFNKQGEMQTRVRIGAGEVKLSMMGALLPGIHAAGAKIYSTLNGRFTFVVVLFSTVDGSLLAVMEGDAMTEFRTAAVTAIAADHLAVKDTQTLAIFGTGIQAKAHIPALLQVRKFSKLLVVGIDRPEAFAETMSNQFNIPCEAVPGDYAAAEADVIVTATRSELPLFAGELVRPGAFVAAIGSSKPTTREIDDTILSRARRIVVEWRPQAKIEAGDLLLAAPGVFDWSDVVELSTVIGSSVPVRQSDNDIIVYKAIGVGLEDVALAELIHRRLSHHG
jgi:ornithine cyclodeaminase/alanine dehydrogenase-like protein (mu-crystallin family)